MSAALSSIPTADSPTKPRRRGTPRSTEITRKAAQVRWSPENRAAEAIRVLVEIAPPLTPEQKDKLRALLAPGVAAAAAAESRAGAA